MRVAPMRASSGEQSSAWIGRGELLAASAAGASACRRCGSSASGVSPVWQAVVWARSTLVFGGCRGGAKPQSGSSFRPEAVGERPTTVGERPDGAGCGHEHPGGADAATPVDPRIRTIAPAPTPGPTGNTPSAATAISTAVASNTEAWMPLAYSINQLRAICPQTASTTKIATRMRARGSLSAARWRGSRTVPTGRPERTRARRLRAACRPRSAESGGERLALRDGAVPSPRGVSTRAAPACRRDLGQLCSG